MKRRQFTTKAVMIGGIGMAAAGCTSDTGSPLEIQKTEAESTGFGNVRILVWVANGGGEPVSSTVVTQVNVEQGDTYTKSRPVTVPGGQTNRYEIKHDIDLAKSVSGFRYQYDTWLESE